ncbi:hypothetical protein KUCAC02_035771 [Chaenocephalus aceratus]|nr:hypothetical protein KUCAC02_035771 [Chaenocephalus aceratus]
MLYMAARREHSVLWRVLRAAGNRPDVCERRGRTDPKETQLRNKEQRLRVEEGFTKRLPRENHPLGSN